MRSNMAGILSHQVAMLTGVFFVEWGTQNAKCQFGRPQEALKTTQRLFSEKWTNVREH